MQNLQVSQVNFGTSSAVPVDINVTALAKQAQITATANDGVSADTKASTTITFGDGSTLKITAPSTGTSAAGVVVAFQESANVPSGSARATFNEATNTLTVSVSNSGTTSDQTIANAINSGTTFTAKASTTLATNGYTAGVDTRTDGITNITTADGGKLQIKSLDTADDADTVVFSATTSVTAANPTVSLSGNTLTIDVSSNGNTSLASIAAAINKYTLTNATSTSGEITAAVTNSGSFDTVVNPTTGIQPDSVGSATTASATAITITGCPKRPYLSSYGWSVGRHRQSRCQRGGLHANVIRRMGRKRQQRRGRPYFGSGRRHYLRRHGHHEFAGNGRNS